MCEIDTSKCYLKFKNEYGDCRMYSNMRSCKDIPIDECQYKKVLYNNEHLKEQLKRKNEAIRELKENNKRFKQYSKSMRICCNELQEKLDNIKNITQEMLDYKPDLADERNNWSYKDWQINAAQIMKEVLGTEFPSNT